MKTSLNFQASINEKDLKKITSDENIKNYSVKNEAIVLLLQFDKTIDKENF